MPHEISNSGDVHLTSSDEKNSDTRTCADEKSSCSFGCQSSKLRIRLAQAEENYNFVTRAPMMSRIGQVEAGQRVWFCLRRGVATNRTKRDGFLEH